MDSTTHGYQLIKDMPIAPPQLLLTQYLAKRPELSQAAKDRYTKLDQYYRVCKLLGALDGTTLQSSYGSLFTGFSGVPWPLDWESGYKAFLQGEGISANILLPDPAIESLSSIRRMLEDMRRVRVAMLLLHATMPIDLPLFDMVRVTPTASDEFLDAGLLPMDLLTRFHFFRYINGAYDLSQVYTPQIESWLNTGRPYLRRGNLDWLATRGWSKDDMLYMVDLEFSELIKDGELDVSFLAIIQAAMQQMHDRAPAMLLGYYLWFPHRDVDATYTNPTSDRYKAWQEINDVIASLLVRYTDFWMPSIYPIQSYCTDQNVCVVAEGDTVADMDWNTTKARWSTFANAMISESLRAGGKKAVIPTMLAYHHPNAGRNPLSLQPLTYDYMSYQLGAINSSGAHGAAIYDDNNSWSSNTNSWYWAVVDHIHDRRRRFVPILNEHKAGTPQSPVVVSEHGPDDTDLQVVSSDARNIVKQSWTITYTLDGVQTTKQFRLHEGENAILIELLDAFANVVLLKTTVNYDVSCVVAGPRC